MKEYYIVASSFAAPFVSDTSEHFQEAPDPREALERFAKQYKHPCGLYAAGCYEDATAFHKGKPMLARWLSNHARVIEESRATSLRSDGPGVLVLDGKPRSVGNPKEGHATLCAPPSTRTRNG